MLRRLAACVLSALMLVGCGGKAADSSGSAADGEPTDEEISEYLEELDEFTDGNALSFEDIGKILDELGIPVSSEKLEKAENAWNGLDSEEMDLMNKTAFLLDRIGRGSYDKETRTFTPSCEQVFSISMENGASDQTLTTFFEGVNTISHGKVTISDIVLGEPITRQENLDIDVSEIVGGFDEDGGTCVRKLQFTLNGEPCTFYASFYYDWFDLNLVQYLNKIISRQGQTKELRFAENDSRCIFFYCDEQWTENLEQRTGCMFSDRG